MQVVKSESHHTHLTSQHKNDTNLPPIKGVVCNGHYWEWCKEFEIDMMILSVCDDDDNILKHCIIPCTLPSPFICKSHWSCVNHQKVVHKLQVIIPSSTWFALGPPLRRCLDWPPTKHCIGRLLCFVVCVRRSWAKGVYNNMQWSNKLDGGGPVVGDNIVMVGHNHSVPMLELETSLQHWLLCCTLSRVVCVRGIWAKGAY